ncbi:MAG: hypothetical protein R3A10_07320 [Caldilineaceae bacterium]
MALASTASVVFSSHLTEDLRLAEHQRVKAGLHFTQMPVSFLPTQHVVVVGQQRVLGRACITPERHQPRGLGVGECGVVNTFLPCCVCVDDGVQFQAIAGG